MLRQIGVEGIVTSLYEKTPGEIWNDSDIKGLKSFINDSGLRWSVVESLPVSEGIKYGSRDRDRLISNYIISLENLGRNDIHTVCYNFMPVIDWVRTDIEYELPDGSSTLYFNYAELAWFDVNILQRKDAENDYPADVLDRMKSLPDTPEHRNHLIDTIITKTQGFITGPLGDSGDAPVARFKSLMKPYADVSKKDLRENLKYFLEAVMPVCAKYDINMCIHPDDPPMPVFGLPRIVCNAEDIRWILDAVPDTHNGLTFCAGSISSGAHNDVTGMAREFASRTRFVHLRSCETLPGGDFIEAPHTGGRADIPELIRIFDSDIPMRVDHGREILDDAKACYNPGYSFHGRMMALAQVQGMMYAIEKTK